MATLKDILPQIPKDELSILRDLNLKLDESKLTEATARETAQAVKTIIQNWKGWSKAMLIAMLLTPNISNALETYSPDTLQDIKTEISKDTTRTDSVGKTMLPNALKAFSFTQNFESGKATLSNSEKIVSELKNWLKDKDASKFKIVIFAGESQVTNPKGFEKKGSLAQARAKEVEKAANEAGFNKVDIEVQIGTTPYKLGDDKNDPKYKEEQFVTINIVSDNSICSMEDIDGGGKKGISAKDYITTSEYLSGKGELKLSTGQVPDRLVIIDANGNILEDTGYITTQASRYKDWKYTPLHVLELTKAYQQETKATQGNKIKTITVKDYNDLIKQLSNVDSPQLQGDEIGPALVQMKKMIEGGQKQFVIYDLGTSEVNIKFDENRGDVQAVVYSPIGSTGYNISGFCYK